MRMWVCALVVLLFSSQFAWSQTVGRTYSAAGFGRAVQRSLLRDDRTIEEKAADARKRKENKEKAEKEEWENALRCFPTFAARIWDTMEGKVWGTPLRISDQHLWIVVDEQTIKLPRSKLSLHQQKSVTSQERALKQENKRLAMMEKKK